MLQPPLQLQAPLQPAPACPWPSLRHGVTHTAAVHGPQRRTGFNEPDWALRVARRRGRASRPGDAAPRFRTLTTSLQPSAALLRLVGQCCSSITGARRILLRSPRRLPAGGVCHESSARCAPPTTTPDRRRTNLSLYFGGKEGNAPTGRNTNETTTKQEKEVQSRRKTTRNLISKSVVLPRCFVLVRCVSRRELEPTGGRGGGGHFHNIIPRPLLRCCPAFHINSSLARGPGWDWLRREQAAGSTAPDVRTTTTTSPSSSRAETILIPQRVSTSTSTRGLDGRAGPRRPRDCDGWAAQTEYVPPSWRPWGWWLAAGGNGQDGQDGQGGGQLPA